MRAIIVLPYPVSPLIKLARWICLLSGIFYGIKNHKKYSILAAEFREEEMKRKILRDKQKAREEQMKNIATARELAEALTGLKVHFNGKIDINENDSTSNDDTTQSDNVTQTDGVTSNNIK